MPRHKYLGRTIPDTKEHNYIETRITFADYIKSPKSAQIQKPVMQGSLEVERVDSMVEEYIEKPYLFHCKDKILVADLNNNWFIVDGQHRLEMVNKLYHEHNKFEDNHKFTFCWFKVSSNEELETLFTSINKDSIKNEYYITQDITDRIKINTFIDEFKQHYNNYFNKKKSSSPNSRVFSIEEFRDKLIEIEFFRIYYTKSPSELIQILKSKNDEFYTINRYDTEVANNPDSFYQDEKTKMKDKIILALKKNNFIQWLKNPDHEPYHLKRHIKKHISQKLRKQVWEKEFGTSFQNCCPIKDCSNIIKNDKYAWHAGHVVSEHHGGLTVLDNLRPICPQCNLDMGTCNWTDYEL